MEGIYQNYIVYDLTLEMAWRKEAVDIKEWVAEYCNRQYLGTNSSFMVKALLG